VCGPAPLLGCRPIRVRVESIYIVSHLLSMQQFTLLHGIKGLGLGFPPTFHCSRRWLLPTPQPPPAIAAPGRPYLPSRGRPPSSTPHPPPPAATTSASSAQQPAHKHLLLCGVVGHLRGRTAAVHPGLRLRHGRHVGLGRRHRGLRHRRDAAPVRRLRDAP
jgi:hypothetical protein